MYYIRVYVQYMYTVLQSIFILYMFVRQFFNFQFQFAHNCTHCTFFYIENCTECIINPNASAEGQFVCQLSLSLSLSLLYS